VACCPSLSQGVSVSVCSSGIDGPSIKLLVRIDDWLLTFQTGAITDLARDQRSDAVVDLEQVVYTQAWQELAPETVPRLDRLRKKIEVAHKLSRYYLPDLSRPAAATPLSFAAIQCLSVLLLKAALVWRDARYLNSALKLMDGVLERDDCVFSQDVRSLVTSTLNVMVPEAPSAA